MKHRIYPPTSSHKAQTGIMVAVFKLVTLALLLVIVLAAIARAEAVPAVPEPFTGRLSIIEGTTIDIECLDSNLLEWRIDVDHIRVNCSSTDRDDAK